MKGIFNPFEIEKDKLNHFFYGTIICVITYIITHSEYFSFFTCFIIAFIKEIYDHFFGSKFDWLDIIWTLLGGLVIFIRLI